MFSIQGLTENALFGGELSCRGWDNFISTKLWQRCLHGAFGWMETLQCSLLSKWVLRCAALRMEKKEKKNTHSSQFFPFFPNLWSLCRGRDGCWHRTCRTPWLSLASSDSFSHTPAQCIPPGAEPPPRALLACRVTLTLAQLLGRAGGMDLEGRWGRIKAPGGF